MLRRPMKIKVEEVKKMEEVESSLIQIKNKKTLQNY
jgi:hypothetical protein